MDCVKIGQLICRLRKEKTLTQLQLAQQLGVGDKAVSKWERGLGCPDLSLLPSLSKTLGVNLEALLAGELAPSELVGGNMKKLNFYVCPDCGNLLTATAEAAVSCCGKKLPQLLPRKAEADQKLSVELVENEYFVSSDHPMTKEHYLSFVALLTGDSVLFKKLYPEWNLQARLPRVPRGSMLVWYCTEHGLWYQLV